MKKFIIVSALTLASIMSTSAFAVTSEQERVISESQTVYNQENGASISLTEMCNMIVVEDHVQLKYEYIDSHPFTPIETCPTDASEYADFMAYMDAVQACMNKNSQITGSNSLIMQTIKDFDIKAGITDKDCNGL